MTPAQRAANITRAKALAIPVQSCVAARLRPDHLFAGVRTKDELTGLLKALVIVLAEAADPVTLRAVVAEADDGRPEAADRMTMLRKAHTECADLKYAGAEIPLRLKLLEREYHTEVKRLQREAAAWNEAVRVA